MVVMIPPFMGEEVKSNAERKIYEVLKKVELKNAYVLHSLGLPKHKSKIYGEVDFVLICDRGIACLEIKGGRVEYKQGQWIFTDRYGKERVKPESPFTQVIGNMFSMKEIIKKQFSHIPQLKNLLVASGVMFPDIEFKSDSQEIIHEIVYDKTCKDISGYLNKVFDYWENRQEREYRKLPPSAIEEIVKFLRGEFSFIPNLFDRLDTVDKNLLRLTYEQVQVIRGLEDNNHLMIEGKAGTGKTTLALEFALNKAKDGNKVLFLTFNKNLSNHISECIPEYEDLKIINIHALFGEYVEIDLEKLNKNPSEYFSETLPNEFLDYISSLGENLEKLQYDVIVIDEGQDLIKPLYLYSLDYLLKGGLSDGKWAIFYDQEQNIYNLEYEEGMELINSYHFTKFQLFVNCRNTVQIGTYASKVSGMDLNKFIKEFGEEVQKVEYDTDEEYIGKINEILKNLKKEKISMSEVVFLSPKRYRNTKLFKMGIEVNELGQVNDEINPSFPNFSTIQGFKGLDSKIVILCELESIRARDFSKYMYISTTRARTLLYVLGSAEFWKEHS